MNMSRKNFKERGGKMWKREAHKGTGKETEVGEARGSGRRGRVRTEGGAKGLLTHKRCHEKGTRTMNIVITLVNRKKKTTWV